MCIWRLVVPHDVAIGWDIGGAHLKMAIATSHESVHDVHQVACPLWLGIEHLNQSIHELSKYFPSTISKHAITMTGELADVFPNRTQGIDSIVKAMEQSLDNSELYFYAGDNGLVKKNKISTLYTAIGSANWLVSANFVAMRLKDALFIDIGSTTTDIIRIDDHRVNYDGYTDAERLYSRELVYCGAVRTPLFALCKSAPIDSKFIPIINELFSNSADVYRLTNELPDHADMGTTPDGQSKSKEDSARRIARMFGFDSANVQLWETVAEYIREQQIQMILNACRKQVATSMQANSVPIVGAGVGRFLAKQIARRMNRPYIDFNELIHFDSQETEISAADCAPATAVACLAMSNPQ